MLDLEKIPQPALSAARARGHSEADILKMTAREIFVEFCLWNGLINWGDELWECAGALRELSTAAAETKVVLWMDGGLVQGVMAATPLELYVLDYDTEGADKEELTDIPQADGKTAQAYTGIWSAEVDPIRNAELVRTVEESALQQDAVQGSATSAAGG